MELILRVFVPVPYVDASAASAFSDKHRRMAVGAAGILVELALAASAFLLWLVLQPGLARDITLDVMFIGGISTLLFNGNPLLRFDGYYILADAVEIPNLGPRASRYLGYLTRRYLFGMPTAHAPVTGRGERGWFVVYGLASVLYRLTISLAIALYVAGKWFLVGTILAVWVLVGQIFYPLVRFSVAVARDAGLQGRRLRTALVSALGVAAAFGLALGVPVPASTRAEGVMRVPEEALVRAPEDGFVARVLQPDGTPVTLGDPLFELTDPLLRARITALRWHVRELQARRDATLLSDRARTGIIEEDLDEARAELTETEARRRALRVASSRNGTFLVPGIQDLPGRFVRRGELLGYVTDRTEVTARVVVPEAASDRIRRNTVRIAARLVSRPATVVEARLLREVPLASDRLPSRLLGSQAGGGIAVDARDQHGLKTLGPVFQFDLALPPGRHGDYPGSRLIVRFEHGKETLARKGYRALRQALLAHLAS